IERIRRVLLKMQAKAESKPARTDDPEKIDVAGREKELASKRKGLGPEHLDTLTAMGDLAGSYFDAGRQDDALKQYEELLVLRRKVSGPEHHDTLQTMTWV